MVLTGGRGKFGGVLVERREKLGCCLKRIDTGNGWCAVYSFCACEVPWVLTNSFVFVAWFGSNVVPPVPENCAKPLLSLCKQVDYIFTHRHSIVYVGPCEILDLSLNYLWNSSTAAGFMTNRSWKTELTTMDVIKLWGSLSFFHCATNLTCS